MKKLTAAALAAALCVSSVTAANVCAVTMDMGGISASEGKVAEITDSGKCGGNAEWILENDKLTISGIGKMKNWEMSNDTPWADYKKYIAYGR